jgi:hypothetical protein
MIEMHKALADIGDIRLRLAAGTVFRGFGPAVIAVTGGLAFILGVVQTVGFAIDPDPILFFAPWIALAVLSAALIGVEMRARTRRHHGGLADAMVLNAVEHFLPFGAGGAVIGGIFARFAPEISWLLPGLWQVILSLGLFASLRFLPRTIAIAAAWYFVAGAVVLALGCDTRALSPAEMALPFGIGQLLLAVILRLTQGGEDDRQH